jgi:hypothetical protein
MQPLTGLAGVSAAYDVGTTQQAFGSSDGSLNWYDVTASVYLTGVREGGAMHCRVCTTSGTERLWEASLGIMKRRACLVRRL